MKVACKINFFNFESKALFFFLSSNEIQSGVIKIPGGKHSFIFVE